jgi:hypothetical protein
MGRVRTRRERVRTFESMMRNQKKRKKPNVHGVTNTIDQGQKSRQTLTCAIVSGEKDGVNE